jgi:hypothetical protein
VVRRRPSALISLVLALALLAAGGILGAGAQAATPGGYWLVGSDGTVYEFGGARLLGSATRAAGAAPIVAMAATPSGKGYWVVDSDGKVRPFGDAPTLGSASGTHSVVGIAATATGGGYWLVTSVGGIFRFGDAVNYGSMAGTPLNKPVVGLSATSSGHGYWMVASDGGIFAFGDAQFLGSTGGIRLNKPIVGLATMPSGSGYWLVASDGGIFAFGDAPFYGSAGSMNLSQPIVTIVPTPSGDGYWMTDTRGRVFPFGAAVNAGDATGCTIPAPVVGMAASGSGTLAPAPDPRPNCGLPAPPPAGAPFDIGLIGDTGYSSTQDTWLLQVRAQMATFPLAFVTHDGDTQQGNTPCTASRDQYVYDTFNGFAAPFIYTPGDNEWRDCPSDPIGRLAALRSKFFSTDQSLGLTTIPLTRQSPTYVENARWTKGNVVFATFNVPGPSGKSPSATETSARHTANVDWMNAAFDQAEASHAAAVMVIWQDDPFDGSSDTSLVATLKSRATAFGKPVVLVHGDTHHFQITKPWSTVPNFTRVETYGTSGTNHWVKATVDPGTPGVFSFTTMTI